MANSDELEETLQALKEGHERLEAKIDRFLATQKPTKSRRKTLVSLPEGADRGTKATRLEAARAFGLRVTKGA